MAPVIEHSLAVFCNNWGKSLPCISIRLEIGFTNLSSISSIISYLSLSSSWPVKKYLY